MKYILLSILFSNTLFALTPRDQKILTLLKGEIKMIKNVKKKKSKLRYRLLELYSEKLGFTQQIENEIFMKSFAKAASYAVRH